jgi:hypothetical protein
MRFGTTLAAALVVATLLPSIGHTQPAAPKKADPAATGVEPGVNSSRCKRSDYNCSLNVDGRGQRIRTPKGDESWEVDMARLKQIGRIDPTSGRPAVPILDGNGKTIGLSKNQSFTLNVGQKRSLGGVEHVFALSTGLKAAGWVGIDNFRDRDQLRRSIGDLRARGNDLKALQCFEIADRYDQSLEAYKVVYGVTDRDEMEPNDYLPVARAGGAIYANLAFNVPGDALGGPAVDIFPAGSRFQQVAVPVKGGKDNALSVKLYEKDPATGAYTITSARSMQFIYGYIKPAEGDLRYGWMPVEALRKSQDCARR